MVLLNASKNARHSASIINRANCGGNKQSGLAKGIGRCLSSNVRVRGLTNTLFGLTCAGSLSKTVQTQRYGYRATLGP
jgi:hypothetical protein